MKEISDQPLTLVPATGGDMDALVRLLALAFGFDDRRAREYLAHVTLGAVWTVRTAASGLVASAVLLPTAHVLHGSDVPAVNIAHVAIAPEARGRGLVVPLVDALCREARRQGALMVSLFASARPVYRRCGFELAGQEIVYEAETAALPTRSALRLDPLDLADPRLARAYDAKASAGAGLLRRSVSHWAELGRAPTDRLAAFGVGDAALDAYLLLDASDPGCLELRDWHASSGAHAAALLAFVGRFRSVYPKVRWHGGPHDDLVAAMPDKGWRIAHQEEWLARILDPQAALARRGFLARDVALGLVIDEGEAALALRLVVQGGQASVARTDPSGLATVRVGHAAFASLFTGFRSASTLARQGGLSGDAEALRLCDLAFAGPPPWVAEHF